MERKRIIPTSEQVLDLEENLANIEAALNKLLGALGMVVNKTTNPGTRNTLEEIIHGAQVETRKAKKWLRDIERGRREAGGR